MPDEIETLMKKLAYYLRNNLFKMTDEQLGLGIEGEAQNASREVLYMLLQVTMQRHDTTSAFFYEWAREQFESASEYCNFKFNFKPGKPRKSRKRKRD